MNRANDEMNRSRTLGAKILQDRLHGMRGISNARDAQAVQVQLHDHFGFGASVLWQAQQRLKIVLYQGQAYNEIKEGNNDFVYVLTFRR